MLNDMDFIKTCDVPGPTKEAINKTLKNLIWEIM